jgi:hypothetical protein
MKHFANSPRLPLRNVGWQSAVSVKGHTDINQLSMAASLDDIDHV